MNPWYDEPDFSIEPISLRAALVSIAIGLAVGALLAWPIVRWVTR